MRRRKTNINTTSFNKTEYAEAEVIDKITLWALRIILKAGGKKEFVRIKYNDFSSDVAAGFLGLEEYIIDDELNKSEVYQILEKKLEILEKQKTFGKIATLENNINRLRDVLNLSEIECLVLEFFVMHANYDLIEIFTDMLGSSLNTNQTLQALSIILAVPLQDIKKVFDSGSTFSKSALLSIYRKNTCYLKNKFEFISDAFSDYMISKDVKIDKLLKEVLQECNNSKLSLEDYNHIKKDTEILVSYMTNAIKSRQKGVNILLYGLPGVGKTELAKVLAQSIEAQLYEVSYCNEDDEAIDGSKRLKSYKVAQNLLTDNNTILMYDEAEDIFDISVGFFGTKRQKDKAWINRMLETNPIPTIWITNNIDAIDGAIVRRFDLSIEIPIPKKSQRLKIIKDYCDDLIDEKTITKLASNENIAPAVISQAKKVISTIEIENKSEAFEHILNNTLKAQGYEEIEKVDTNLLPSTYNPKYINTTCDMSRLMLGIKENQNARICLYGPAGTGKSAYGKYLADALEKPLIIKKGSDLLSMWVGGTEKNIARAFEEAKDEKAVLVFDEVDGFLADRSSASKNWEITQVNEMLVQMESFDGIFVATTNLMDNLDKASLRRFDMKLEFSYLSAIQAWDLFVSECKALGVRISKSIQKDIKDISYLTPGDFASIKRQHRFNKIKNCEDFYQRLLEEVAIKNASSIKKVGFIK